MNYGLKANIERASVSRKSHVEGGSSSDLPTAQHLVVALRWRAALPYPPATDATTAVSSVLAVDRKGRRSFIWYVRTVDAQPCAKGLDEKRRRCKNEALGGKDL